jgi:hypothetical protein
MSRSQRAGQLGASVERQARERYGLESEHDGMHDAVDREGTPVEIKGAMREMANGREGRFIVYESAHRALVRADGRYVLAVYRDTGQAAEVLAWESVPARAMPELSWHRVDHTNRGEARQAKVRWSRVVRP